MKSNLGWRSVRIAATSRALLPFVATLSTHLLLLHVSMARSLHCSRSSRALRSVFSTSQAQGITLPAFLVPALAPTQPAAHFSSTTKCHSKIGRAPLSLPPEVTFRILETPPKKQSRGMSRSEPDRSVEIEGPLGKMSMDIPPFISIASNEETRTHSVSILDSNDKKQRAMWGESSI